jgi:hypothetical protein
MPCQAWKDVLEYLNILILTGYLEYLCTDITGYITDNYFCTSVIIALLLPVMSSGGCVGIDNGAGSGDVRLLSS